MKNDYVLEEGHTQYYAVYVEQDDKRPVAIFRYQESAVGFAQIYNQHKVKYSIRPLILRNDEISCD